MVKRKLSVHLSNCRGWPWVPTAVRSTHAGLAAAHCPMHAAWRFRKNKKLLAVGLKRSKQRLLVAIGKIVAQSKSVSHMDRKNRQKTRFSARPWKDEPFWATATRSITDEVQNTNWEDWGITCRHWANCVEPWCTRLESVVDRWRGYEERHTDLKKGRVRKRRRSTKDSRRL